MTRIGINPARGKLSAYQPARVSLCIITYIPDESGYFEQRLQVLKLVFASLEAHTARPYDLLVFDNHSCPSVVKYLQSLNEQGLINFLVLSRQNIGKIDALQFLFKAAPGEIIAYSDDDIFFYPGWLEAHLHILENFPQAGMVSGVPVRNAARHATRSLNQLNVNPAEGFQARFERHIPDEWETDWAVSTGRDPQAHIADTKDSLDMLIQRLDTQGAVLSEAVGAANHFQFIGWRSRLLQALPDQWSGKLMGAMIELDDAIDRAGYLRLSTSQRFVRHMGNRISQDVFDTARAYHLITAGSSDSNLAISSTTSARNRRRPILLRIPGSRRIIAWLYHQLFRILYQ